jgi:hypothetical protein
MSVTLNMLPLVRNIQCTRGSARTINLTFTLDGVAYNLTGKTITLTVKDAPTAAGAEVYALDQTSHTNAAGGLSTLPIPATATFGTDGQITTYVHEIRVLPDGIVWFAGAFEVHPTGAPV